MICVHSCQFVVSFLGRSETDLDRRTRLLRVHDYSLVGTNVDELVRSIAFSGGERKLLVFAHFKFLSSAPTVKKPDHGLRRGADLSFNQRKLRVILLMLEQ